MNTRRTTTTIPKAVMLLFFVLIAYLADAQPAKKKAFLKKPPPITEADVSNLDCVYKNLLPAKKRRERYPFNRAAQTYVVSYDTKEPTEDIMDVKIENELPKKNGKIDFVQLDEVRLLTSAGIDSLTDVLYNNRYKGRVHFQIESLCFIPRNAVLFADSNGRVFDYIEICFQCHRMETSSKKVDSGDRCTEKVDLLYKFFISQGIMIGTKNWRGKE